MAALHLVYQGFHIFAALVGAAGGGVEVTVYAAALAKGHVNV